MRVKNYVRYADDFVILSENEAYLLEMLPKIRQFLTERLDLELHPGKIIVKKWHQGIDFLGYVSFPHHIVLRSNTKRRMLRKIREMVKLLRDGLITEESFKQSLESYKGLLKHCRGQMILKEIESIITSNDANL